MKLIAGLGNPGDKYATTRHNIGFMIVDRVALSAGLSMKKKNHQGLCGIGRIDDVEVMLLKPQTYMNRSGASVGSALKSLGIDPGDLIVIHDDIELPFGRLRIKQGGGHGGHNGIRHIREVLGHGEFVRVKVGVDRPPAGGDVSSWVLQNFSSTERKRLDALVDHAAVCIRTMLVEGTTQAMNQFNNRDLPVS